MHSTQEKKLKALGSELTKDIKTGEDLSSLPRSPNKGFPHDESALRWFISRRRQAINRFAIKFKKQVATLFIKQAVYNLFYSV